MGVTDSILKRKLLRCKSGIIQQLALFNNWRNRRKSNSESEEEEVGVAFVYLFNCSHSERVSERGLARIHEYSNPLRCISSKRNPQEDIHQAVSFCVGGSVINWGGNTPTCRHWSLHHWTCTISLEPPKLSNIIGSSHEDAGFVNGQSGLHVPPSGSDLNKTEYHSVPSCRKSLST